MKKLYRNRKAEVRLTQREINTIKTSILSIDTDAKVFLFGSRTDSSKRGGDIDILILSKLLTRKEISQIRWSFFERFGEQKMDIVIDDGTLRTPFVRMIFPKAIQL